jgi:AcrR family transcriptional regulator
LSRSITPDGRQGRSAAGRAYACDVPLGSPLPALSLEAPGGVTDKGNRENEHTIWYGMSFHHSLALMDAQLPHRFAKSDWLALGAQLLSEEGPTALSLERLTEAAGRTKGSFYHHFHGRDGFLAALVEHWRALTLEAEAEPYRDNPDPAAWRDLLHAAPFQLNQPFERGMRRLAVGEPIVRAGVERVDRERIDRLTFLISQLRDDLDDPRAFATLLYAVIVGAQWLLKSADDARALTLRETMASVFPLEPPATMLT